ncbi:MAG TPA: 6-phosphogluconolactonase [Blastocatellia bacterium]|nr:6-phosphogluconolactonase [Blastocatellia bacterium]
MKPIIRIFPDADKLAHFAARLFQMRMIGSITIQVEFTVALSGGATPKKMFEILGNDERLKKQVQHGTWDYLHFFWGDERHVPPDHAESNYKLAYDTMLSKLGVREANIHRIKGELEDAGEAARQYEAEILQGFPALENQIPRFDLIFLGMGSDGHTASLFPGTKALTEEKRLVVSNWVGKFNTDRITMTAPLLNNAACVVFMVSGQDKALPVKATLEGRYEPQQLPAQLIRPESGKLIWLLDSAAASLLRDENKASSHHEELQSDILESITP